jgi:hypothetical protein
MRLHFHLVVETPQPNLVLGMKWLLGVYTKQFNIRPIIERVASSAAAKGARRAWLQ